MKDALRFEYRKGVKSIYPANGLAKNWVFTETEEKEALLANSIAEVAEQNGLTTNDIMHMYPLILRMLKSDIQWSK